MRCNYCERRCELACGRLGVCRMYELRDGHIRECFPRRWSSYGASRIESVPFYHAYPGSRSFVIGTAGCNFNCKYCSNAFIVKQDPACAQAVMDELSAAELVGIARKLGCENIVFNVNEPAVSLQTLAEVSEEAKAANMPMGCLTNAYTTEEGTEILASIFSFFNVGLKGLSEKFNRECIGIPSVAPILRNIKRLARTSHVEIITPVIQGANDHELDEMAGFIAAIDREIPWHVFRLLPEDEMKNARYPNIEAINGALESARKKLPYLYFHNFVGSDWVDTRCPDCGALAIERFSLGCGGDMLRENLCVDGKCPECGCQIRLARPNRSESAAEGSGLRVVQRRTCGKTTPSGVSMSIAIIDAREWQRVFDLQTGQRREATDSVSAMVKGVLGRHPFPGDTHEKSNRWVTDVALELIKLYDPQFIWITYSQQYYNHRYTPMGAEDRAALTAAACREAEHFIAASDFAPVIVGTGDMAPCAGLIDVTRLDGLALSTNWSVRYAGLHDPSPEDIQRLSDMPCIERIVAKDAWLELFSESPCDSSRISDFLLVAAPGYAFKTFGGVHRRLSRIPVSCFSIPVSTNLGQVESITGIRGIVEDSLKKQKTALIFMEGIGGAEFPWPHAEAANGRDWFFHEPGDGQHLSVSAGVHRVFDYPAGYRYLDNAIDNRVYPLSGYFTSIPSNTIGSGFSGRSAAVGNRSMLTHMIPGADISIECFARNLYNQGTMAVIHRQDK